MGTPVKRKLTLRPGFTDLLVLLATFTPFFLKHGTFADDPGVGWHLATGKWVVEHGGAPHTDPFLAADVARPWVSDQWLSDAVLYLLHTQWDWVGPYAALTIVFLLTYFAFGYRAAAVRSGTWLGAAFAALCALKLATIHFILRPVIFGFFFFAVAFLLCMRLSQAVDDDPTLSTKARRWLTLPLVPLFLLWANAHPSFILGLVMLAILTGSFVLQPFFFAESHQRKDAYYRAALSTGVMLGACFLATLLNPYGIELHNSIFALADSSFFARFNAEWHSPDFLEPTGQLIIVLFSLIAGSQFINTKRDRDPSVFDFAMLAAFTIAYLRSVRLLPFLAIVMVVPLARALRDLGNSYAFEWMEALQGIRDKVARAEEWEERSSKGLVGLVIAVVVLTGAMLNGSLWRVDEYGPTRDTYPYEAVEYLLEQPDDAVVFGSPNWGGFITWMGKGRIRAHIDDRNTMLGEQIYRDYLSVATQADGWLPTVKKSGATHLLATTGSSLDHAADDAGLEQVDATEHHVLYRVR